MHPDNDLLVHINVLKRYKLLLWVLPLLSIALGVAVAYFVIPSKWEATAVLEVGQVAGQPVESSSNAVVRMLHPSFSIGTLKGSSGSLAEFDLARSEYKTLKVSQAKGTQLLEVTLRSKSPNKARDLMQMAISHLQKLHSEMQAVTIDLNIKQIHLLDKEIQAATDELSLLKKRLTESHNWNSFDATLSATVLQNKAIDIREMTQKRMLLEEQISPTRTYTTKVVGDIYVSEDPVSPNKVLIIAFALILGLGGGVVLAFVHHAYFNKSK